MSSESLSISEVFTEFQRSQSPSGLVADVAASLAAGNLSRAELNKAFERGGLQPDCRDEFLDLVLFYLQKCLEKHQLTPEEKSSIHQLKLFLHVKEGDFWRFKKYEVADLLTAEIKKILEDRRVDQAEALRMVDIQTAFDLSYDQVLEISRQPVAEIINELLGKVTADGVVTGNERQEFIDQLLALDTVCHLTEEQRRIVFGAEDRKPR